MKIKKILVIDDKTSNADAIKDALSDVGYAVEIANDAIAARERLEEKSFDLLILDIWMPEVDGISFLKELKDKNNQTPVIMISGHAEHSDVVEAMRLGAIDFIKKPISDIASIVRNALNHIKEKNNGGAANFDLKFKEARAEFENAYFAYHMKQNNNNISKVAEISGVERTTLYRKLKQ